MSDRELTALIAGTIGNYLGVFNARVHTLAAELSEQQFWTRPYAYGNSMGHLILHITGNLNYYIGAQIGGSGYVRDRPLEFSDASQRPKADVLAALDAAVAQATTVIGAQSASDWSLPYSAVGTDDKTRYSIVQRCTSHFHHHLGQMIYLVKAHTT